MNKVILSGNLVKDIEIITKNDLNIGKFTLAVSRPYKNTNGEYESDFLNCVIFKANDYVKNNLKKGTKILLEGSIQTKSYEVEGTKRYSTDILVYKIEIEKKAQNDIPTEKLTTKTETQTQFEYQDSDLPW